MRIRKAPLRPAGWEDGYNAGWREGQRLGQCEAISRLTRFDPPVLELRVLYVRTGLWSYEPLDEGVTDALRRLVREVHVVAPTDDAVAAASRFHPDLVLSLNSVECFGLAQVDALRSMGVRTATWFTDDPYYIDVTKHIAPHYDYVFTLEEACVPVYREYGCSNVFHLPFGANTAIYSPQRSGPDAGPDLCFIGSAFRDRAELFDRIAAYLQGRSVFIAGYWWERMAHFGMLEDKIRNGYWVSPRETASYYNRAKIVINLHRSIDDDTNQNVGRVPAYSVNPRSFEIGACAAFQLTDVRQNTGSAFIPGQEIATYASPEELIEKADYYLSREEERREIALRGYHRTLREHTYPRRVRQLLDRVFA